MTVVVIVVIIIIIIIFFFFFFVFFFFFSRLRRTDVRTVPDVEMTYNSSGVPAFCCYLSVPVKSKIVNVTRLSSKHSGTSIDGRTE